VNVANAIRVARNRSRFFEKHRADGDRDRTDGPAVALGGVHHQVVEFVLALSIGSRNWGFDRRIAVVVFMIVAFCSVRSPARSTPCRLGRRFLFVRPAVAVKRSTSGDAPSSRRHHSAEGTAALGHLLIDRTERETPRGGEPDVYSVGAAKPRRDCHVHGSPRPTSPQRNDLMGRRGKAGDELANPLVRLAHTREGGGDLHAEQRRHDQLVVASKRAIDTSAGRPE
jgi:hypothetical protein